MILEVDCLKLWLQFLCNSLLNWLLGVDTSLYSCLNITQNQEPLHPTLKPLTNELLWSAAAQFTEFEWNPVHNFHSSHYASK